MSNNTTTKKRGKLLLASGLQWGDLRAILAMNHPVNPQGWNPPQFLKINEHDFRQSGLSE